MKRKVYPMMLLIVSLLICIGLSISALAANTEIEISSPDESVRFVFSIGTSGSISYTIYKGEANIITDSALGINTDAEDFRSGLSFVSCTQNLVNEDYDLLYGKTASVHDSYRNAGIVLQKNNKTLVLNVKVFNDGVAFNYEIPGSGSVEILTESTEINLPDNTGGWGYNWRSDYEGMYEYRSSASLRNSDVAMPFLASINNNAYWALLTEGDVYNDGSYCASHLKGTLTNKLRVVYAPEQTDNILTEYPVKTPYRVIIITDNLNDLVNSTLVNSLNPQPEEQDTSWIYSGKSAWSWWSEERSPQWFLRQKEYVDFAARNGWEYVTVDAGWDDTWIPALCDYAAPKNVGIIIWTDVGAIDIVPRIGDIKLAALTTLQIQKFYNETKAHGRVQRYENMDDLSLSNKTIRGLHTMLRQCLEQAVTERLIPYNPANGCRLPKKEKKKMQIIPPEKIRDYLKAAEEWGVLPMFYLELSTGVRRGELVALLWSDLNLQTKTLTVSKSVSRGKGELVVTEPKTENSVREIYLSDEAIRLLVEDRKNHPFSPYMFPSPKTGGMYGPDCIGRIHKKLLEKAGIEEHVRFHDLRHTFSTLAIQSGIDPKTVAEILGHASAEFSLDVYTHVTAGMKKEAAQKISGFMASVG